MKAIDLFCGMGGFSLGFQQAGIEIILGVDTWETALKSFQVNHHCEILKADIRGLKGKDLPPCDMLIGSPPCQSFSYAKTLNKGYSESPDLSLVTAFLRLVEELKPKHWIMENVLGSQKYLSLLPCIELNSKDYGVPQMRRRCFYGNIPIPPKQEPLPFPIAPTIMASELEGGVSDIRRIFTKWFRDQVAPTITTTDYKGSNNRWQGGFPEWLNRNFSQKVTIEIIKYFMGFPSDYYIAGNKAEQGKQLGNAVCPPVSKAIGKAILNPTGLHWVNEQKMLIPL